MVQEPPALMSLLSVSHGDPHLQNLTLFMLTCGWQFYNRGAAQVVVLGLSDASLTHRTGITPDSNIRNNNLVNKFPTSKHGYPPMPLREIRNRTKRAYLFYRL